MKIIPSLILLVILVGLGYLFYTFTSNQSSMTSQGNTINSQINGLSVEDIIVGTGTQAQKGNTVSVNYVGTLTNGTKFDSSYDRGTPFEFRLGAGQVIQGWDIGVEGMKIGGKRKLVIAPELGYGDQEVGGVIPANSTLVFEVELLAIK